VVENEAPSPTDFEQAGGGFAKRPKLPQIGAWAFVLGHEANRTAFTNSWGLGLRFGAWGFTKQLPLTLVEFRKCSGEQ